MNGLHWRAVMAFHKYPNNRLKHMCRVGTIFLCKIKKF